MSHAHAQLRLARTHERIEIEIEIDFPVRGVGQAGLAPPNLRYMKNERGVLQTCLEYLQKSFWTSDQLQKSKFRISKLDFSTHESANNEGPTIWRTPKHFEDL